MRGRSIVALIGVAVLSAAGCADADHVVVGGGNSGGSVNVHPSPTQHSACDEVPTKGDANVMVDWVDFVQLHGVQFIAGLDGAIRPIPAGDMGAVVGRVHCQLSALKFKQQPGPAVDGDAAFLTIGTEVHAIRGYKPTCVRRRPDQRHQSCLPRARRRRRLLKSVALRQDPLTGLSKATQPIRTCRRAR